MEGDRPQRRGWRELRVFGRKVRYDMLDNPIHVVAVNCDSVLGETVEVRRVKYIPPILQARNEDPRGHQNATADATNLDFVEPLACGVGEAQEDEAVPPFRDEIIVSGRASHDREEGGEECSPSWPSCIADGNSRKRKVD